MVELISSINTVVLFFLFVMPGLISIQVYRLLMPAKELDWSNAILEGLFYSSLNYGFCLPLLSLITFSFTLEAHPIIYGLIGLFILLIAPILWPIAFTRAIRSKRMMKNLQIPFSRAWDFFFDKRIPCFVLIHLKNGKLAGGYYGNNSFASSYPNDGDIYIEFVYDVDKSGHFGKCIPESKGMLIRHDDYDYIELFSVPPQQGSSNEPGTKP